MADLAKLKLSALLVLPIVSGAATGGAIYASTKGDIAALKDAHAETRQRVEKIEPVVQSQGTDIAVIKAQTEAIMKGVDRLEDRMGTKP